MKIHKIERYECEYCGHKYELESTCKECEELCIKQQECDHDWEYRMSPVCDDNNVYVSYLMILRNCVICKKEQRVDYNNFEKFFDE